MASYAARRGPRTGATLWRVLSDGHKHVVPDGVLDLMWFQNHLVVAGADTRAMSFESVPGEVAWGLRLAPGVAHALLGVPADELTDRRVALSELVALPARSFEVGAADALEQVFIDLWTRADPDRSALRLAASLDRAARDGLSVRETAQLHDLSERSLRRLSNRVFGYGPKSLAQIHRFQRALHLARSGLPLAEAAATAGYVDQAHFTREAKRLAGRTPAALIG
ncbi:helix-turn-helix transcriptional regulator [Saccharopolyspora hirsuta]|uniref:Helix-turn-helix transcriptional regulator n=1 Tax=Saccharopolyspora hirsuta TaxID=1837 RepID=A0A5M7BIU7_SACHI|nr:AraC family transcriptional regulator [Saccharopolyspora hirsuta]KAA5829602.1 helix-turn-helix transcriptional regulator [Saccharopolyspora hirsuta]MBF6511032.1 helix-turn-helix transcriptional regulator [Nocardia farcinica]